MSEGRYSQIGGRSFFIKFLQLVAYFAYGPQQVARLACHNNVEFVTGARQCNTCGIVLGKRDRGYRCQLCEQEYVRAQFTHGGGGGGGGVHFFVALGRHIIALRFPHRAFRLRKYVTEAWGIVGHGGAVAEKPCYGCHTLAKWSDDLPHCAGCFGDRIVECYQGWCRGSERCSMCRNTFCFECLPRCSACSGPAVCGKCRNTLGCQHYAHKANECVWHTQQRFPRELADETRVFLMCSEHAASADEEARIMRECKRCAENVCCGRCLQCNGPVCHHTVDDDDDERCVPCRQRDKRHKSGE